MKKLLLSIALMLTALTVRAYDFEVNGIKYTITSTTDFTCEVTGHTSDSYTLFTLFIPSSVTNNGQSYSVKSIGYNAFSSYDYLQSVTISNGVTSIGAYAFYCCRKLETVSIPASVTNIGDDAFSDCGLTSVVLSSNLTNIGSGAFCRCNLTDLTIPGGVTSIGDYAFSQCEKLTSMTIQNGVTSISNNAFYGCSSLSSVTIPNSVTSIGISAFQNCSSLSSVTIPSSVVSIGKLAFDTCSGLSSVSISEGVADIGVCAFFQCGSLTNIAFPQSLSSIGDYAFGYSGLTSVTIPSNVTNIGLKPFEGCNNMSSMKVDENNAIYDSRDDCNAIIETSTDVLISGCMSTTIPTSVRSIGLGAFYECDYLANVVIPENITSIGDYAFYGCDRLASVTFPEAVTSIGEYAFAYCRSLTQVTIPESVTKIANGTFYCSYLETVTLPKSITSIGDYAFAGCSNLWSLVMLRTTPCQLSANAFSERCPFLYVPYGASTAYKSDETWSLSASNIIENYVEIWDGDSYTNSQNRMKTVNYTRTFNNTSWQPWYVPFDMTLTSDLMDAFAFAKIEGVVIEDQNTADASDDATFISIVRLPEGSVIKGNVPYFVQAKSTGEKTISVENTTVKATESFSFSVNSASNVFTFTGIYEPRTSTAEDCNAWYYFSGGQFCQPGRAGITLKAMRFYMTIAERADNPYATASAGGSKVIGIREVGDGATDIDTTPAYLVAPVDEAVYDLMGRRVSNPQHGLYIVNGQKRFIP